MNKREKFEAIKNRLAAALPDVSVFSVLSDNIADKKRLPRGKMTVFIFPGGSQSDSGLEGYHITVSSHSAIQNVIVECQVSHALKVGKDFALFMETEEAIRAALDAHLQMWWQETTPIEYNEDENLQSMQLSFVYHDIRPIIRP